MNVQKDANIFGDEDSRKFMEKIETEPRVFDKEVEICFNVKFLIDFFENTDSEKITMCFAAFNKPARFEGINSFSVLMPMLKDKSRW
jgi:DNA polymerase III sliding clamp (beta) subunit (PCNA family)